MITLTFCITTTYVLGLALLATTAIKKRYPFDGSDEFADNRSTYVIFACLALLTAAAFGVCELLFMGDASLQTLPTQLRWATAVMGACFFAGTDIKEQIIPNKWVVLLLTAALLFGAANVLLGNRTTLQELAATGLGALVGGGVMLLAALVSRKGLGMGDMKMYAAIGALVGLENIMETMIFGLAISAFAAAGLLISKKAKKGFRMPLAPFAFTGVLAEFILFAMMG